MNIQEAFDKIWERAKDHRKSLIKDDFCAYRSPDGLKCFVGELIPDELYLSSMERKSIYDLIRNYPDIKELFKDVKSHFLEVCQYIHDDYEPEKWHDRLVEHAEDNHLKVPT